MSLIEKIIKYSSLEEIKNIFGNCDENLNLLCKHYDIKIIQRDDEIKIKGKKPAVDSAVRIIEELLKLLELLKSTKDKVIDKQLVNHFIHLEANNNLDGVSETLITPICKTQRGKIIRPKTTGQGVYVNAIKNNTIVFGIGPAGTGKTYLAVALAVEAFNNDKVSRIIMTRPAVEAGEKLGFLPGDLQDKVDPYLRPLHDALFEIMGMEKYNQKLEKNLIEVAPLAYMRGRTLDNSFIILDEAQNTTPEQMKMFLTRIGFNSKVVVTGDITQIDLPRDKKSGLKEVKKILKDIEGIEFVYLSTKDVVRHELVQKIIKAYDKYEKNDGG